MSIFQALPDEMGHKVLVEFLHADHKMIRSPVGYIVGILRKLGVDTAKLLAQNYDRKSAPPSSSSHYPMGGMNASPMAGGNAAGGNSDFHIPKRSRFNDGNQFNSTPQNYHERGPRQFFPNSGSPLMGSSGLNETHIVTYLDPGRLPSPGVPAFRLNENHFFKKASFSFK